MKTFISSYAQNHFGVLIDAARIAPVAVTKYDKPFVVVMAVEEYERLVSVNGCVEVPPKRTNLKYTK